MIAFSKLVNKNMGESHSKRVKMDYPLSSWWQEFELSGADSDQNRRRKFFVRAYRALECTRRLKTQEYLQKVDVLDQYGNLVEKNYARVSLEECPRRFELMAEKLQTWYAERVQQNGLEDRTIIDHARSPDDKKSRSLNISVCSVLQAIVPSR